LVKSVWCPGGFLLPEWETLTRDLGKFLLLFC
jgi:hypothetical protein